MTRIAACLLSYALTSLWQLPLFAAAGWLVSRMLQRLGPVAQYRVWVTALVLGVAGPAWGLLPWGPGGSASTSVADLLTTAASAGRETAFAFHQGPLWLPPTVFWGLTIAYVASIGIRGFRLAWGLRATAALLRDAQPPAMTEAGSAVWERCQRRFAVGGARLLCSPRVRGPVTLGLRRPLLLLPLHFFEEFAGDDVAAALGHECAHLERCDFVINVALQVLVLPAALPTGFLLAHIAEGREQICDELAAERICDGPRYAKALLRLAAIVGRPAAAPIRHAVGLFDSRSLERRIMNLTMSKRVANNGLRRALVLTGILAMGLASAAALAGRLEVQEQTTGTAQSQGKTDTPAPLEKIGRDVKAPVLLEAPDAAYPKGETKSGVCVVAVVVNRDGLPEEVHVVKPLGAEFDSSAVTAVKQYRFKPATKVGKPVPVRVHVEVQFQRY